MTGNWGRFTVYGSDELEAQITDIVRSVSDIVGHCVHPNDYKALVLIGGYGRGEGGVEIVDGVERPHNNLDFLLITREYVGQRDKDLKRMVDAKLGPLIERYGVGIDFSTIPAPELESAPCLVMWYDMRYGHKTILGDKDYVRNLKQFTLDKLLAADVRNLMTNRGSLFVINDALLAQGDLTEVQRRTIIRHAMKGIIGYGDALLYVNKQYDWSYREKQQRMKRLQGVDESFRAAYDMAAEFRFRPDYRPWMERDLAEWMNQIRNGLADVHLQVESARLNHPGLTWDNYPELALEYVSREAAVTMTQKLKLLVNYLSNQAPRLPYSSAALRGYRMAGPRGLMPVVYPVVAYRLQQTRYRDLARHALNAESSTDKALRDAYLRNWGQYIDINFASAAAKMGLRIDV